MSVKDEQISTRLHSIASAAEFLGGLSISTIRRWIAIGRLRSMRVGRRVMISESELLGLIKPHEIDSAKQPLCKGSVAEANE